MVIASNPAADQAPPLVAVAGRYRMRLAASDADLRAIFRLRFRVFNLELDEGLASAYDSGEDRDAFDAQCVHLLVEEKHSGEIIGTYRMQTREMAAAGAGFYAASEFALDDLPADVLDNAIELGRACIDERHRNSRVLFLLWRGLAAYMTQQHKRYFFGCCSLTSQDPAEGVALHAALRQRGHCHPTFEVAVQPDYRCVAAASAAPKIPKLMRLYLAYGAHIVSGPALDRAFSTIDYLALFDINTLGAKERRMFLDA